MIDHRDTIREREGEGMSTIPGSKRDLANRLQGLQTTSWKNLKAATDAIAERDATIAALRAALEQAREALEPFELVCNALESSEGADLLDDTTEWTWGDAEVPFTLGDLRRTRTALAAINSALTKA